MRQKETPADPGTNPETIRREVDGFYQKISEGEIKTAVSPEALYQSLGYDLSLLAELPEEVRLGLSCGNPLEHLFIEEGETLLDLGSGTGMDVFLARRKFPQAAMIYGLDRLPGMIARAEKALGKLNYSGVGFKLGTLTDMPFADGSVDKVISNCVINLEPEKQRVYEEIHRVLRPGGMFFISDITLKQELSEDIKAMKNLHGSWVGGALPLEELLTIMKKTGFAEVVPLVEDVTPEYAAKWGTGLDLKNYIQSGLFIGKKPE